MKVINGIISGFILVGIAFCLAILGMNHTTIHADSDTIVLTPEPVVLASDVEASQNILLDATDDLLKAQQFMSGLPPLNVINRSCVSSTLTKMQATMEAAFGSFARLKDATENDERNWEQAKILQARKLIRQYRVEALLCYADRI